MDFGQFAAVATGKRKQSSRKKNFLSTNARGSRGALRRTLGQRDKPHGNEDG